MKPLFLDQTDAWTRAQRTSDSRARQAYAMEHKRSDWGSWTLPNLVIAAGLVVALVIIIANWGTP